MEKFTARFSTIFYSTQFFSSCENQRTLGQYFTTSGRSDCEPEEILIPPTPSLIRNRLILLMQVNKSALTVEKNKGHKRHILTDFMRNILAVKVHRANLHDTKAGIFPAVKACRKYPTIQAICADAGYRKNFVANVQTILDLRVDISPKIKAVGFHVVKKRWVEERSFAWLGNSRRLAKDLEKTVADKNFALSYLAKRL